MSRTSAVHVPLSSIMLAVAGVFVLAGIELLVIGASMLLDELGVQSPS